MSTRRAAKVSRYILCFAFIASACSHSADVAIPTESETKVAAGESASTESSLGPVTARVIVVPKEPLIGDIMSLTLEVEAKPGVDVTMPMFQEAFSRFAI